MDEFTNEEKSRIDQLYGNDFNDVTPDDAKLIARWEKAKANEEAKRNAEISAIIAESEQRLKTAKEQSDYAMETLRLQRERALKRFERASNGETEQE